MTNVVLVYPIAGKFLLGFYFRYGTESPKRKNQPVKIETVATMMTCSRHTAKIRPRKYAFRPDNENFPLDTVYFACFQKDAVFVVGNVCVLKGLLFPLPMMCCKVWSAVASVCVLEGNCTYSVNNHLCL